MAATRTRRGQRRRTRGQALVEFALVIPIFMLVLCGILDFGFMLFTRMSVINAARDGARAAIVLTDKSQVPAIVGSQAQGSASGGGLGTVTVSETCVAYKSSPSCNFSTSTGAKSGDAVLVTVSYPYQSFFPLLFGTTFTLTGSVEMVFE
jgi:Flp pilus assembly protein TadG